jgi:hypothetical protein
MIFALTANTDLKLKALRGRKKTGTDHADSCNRSTSRRQPAKILVIEDSVYSVIDQSHSWIAFEVLELVIKVPTLRYAERMIRIGIYNMREARGLDPLYRPERTLRVINGLDARVVTLKEANKRSGARHTAIPREMIEAEANFPLVEVSRNEISLGWHGNAIFVRK